MRPLLFVAFLIAAPTSAQAACTLGAAQFSLSDYSAIRPSAGTFSATVRCDKPSDAYRLDLVGPAGSTLNGRDSVSLRLTSAQAEGGSLTVLLLNPDGLLGTTLQGSRTLRWPVQVSAGQWAAAAGPYTVQVGLVLSGAGQVQGLGPASLFSPPLNTPTPWNAPSPSGDQP